MKRGVDKYMNIGNRMNKEAEEASKERRNEMEKDRLKDQPVEKSKKCEAMCKV